MVPSIFDQSERIFLLAECNNYFSLPLTAQTEDGMGSYKPREVFLSQIIDCFFQKFPLRDIERSPNSTIAFTAEIRNRLHQIITKLLRNHRQKNQQEDSHPVLPRPGGISTLGLFKQRYKARIKERSSVLIAEGEFTEKLAAYNAAVTAEFKAFQEQEPDEAAELDELARSMKDKNAKNFEEQDFETKEVVLEMLPVEIARALNDWQRRTGVCIYLMAIWAQPGGGLGTFDYATKNCGRFLKSSVCEDVREQWQDWMKSEKGAVLTGNIEEARPTIYPNDEGFPQYPNLSGMNVSLAIQVKLLRRYFTLFAIVIGGTAPYERIAEDMRNGTCEWIRPQCFPEGCRHFDDPKWWSKANANAFGNHLVAGQNQSIPPQIRFCFALIPGMRGTSLGPARPFLPVPAPGVQIPWTTEEIIYGEKMSLGSPSRAELDVAFRSLPVARCSHIYQPFKADVFEKVELLHSSHKGVIDLFKEIAAMEELGPIHNTFGFSDSTHSSNPHIPHSKEISLARTFLPALPLPIEFFDAHHPRHPNMSCFAFKQWLVTQQPHIHKESGTVYSGLRGVRGPAMAVSRMWQNVEYVKEGSLPDEIRPKVAGPNRTWVDELMRATLDEIVEQLRRDVARSRTVLMVTYPQRVELWRQGVRERLQEASDCPGDPCYSTPDRGITATSGVPNYVPLLEEMNASIEQSLDNFSNSNDHFDVSQIMELREERMIQSLCLEAPGTNLHEDLEIPRTLSSSRANTPGEDGEAIPSDSGSEPQAPAKQRDRPRAQRRNATGSRGKAAGRITNNVPKTCGKSNGHSRKRGKT